MGIDLQALSITKTITSIISYFRSQENNSAWKDLTTGAEGLFLIRLLANVLTNISYRLVTARRENYLSTANLLSSNIGIGMNVGYSAYRGRNQHRKIRVTALTDIALPKYTIIGSYDDEYDIIFVRNISSESYTNEESAERLDGNVGTQYTIEVVIGKLKSIEIEPQTKEIKVFTQFTENISEDFALYRDGLEVPTTKQKKEMVDNKYLVVTNPYKSVDICYLNGMPTSSYNYDEESIIELKYVELADVETIDFTSDMFADFELIDTLTISQYIPFEEVKDVKVNAPINHEVQNLIRSKADYSKEFKRVVPNVKMANYTAMTPTYTLVSYLKDDYTLLEEDEAIEINKVLNRERFFGTPLPDITKPERLVTQLKILLTLNNKYINMANIRNDINSILKTNYDVLMNQTFNTFDLERLIENTLGYVRYARISLDAGERQSSTTYIPGVITTNAGTHYMVSKIQASVGSVKPNWQIPVELGKEIDLNYEITDGNIIWHAYKKLPSMDGFKTRVANGLFTLNDYITVDDTDKVVFKCVNMYKNVGNEQPDTEDIEVGDFILDGEVIWVCIPYLDSDTIPDWGATADGNGNAIRTDIKLGDKRQIGGKTFQCISFAGHSSSNSTIAFEISQYDIDEAVENGFYIDGDITQYVAKDDIIEVVGTTEVVADDSTTSISEHTYSFTVNRCTYLSSETRTYIQTKQEVNTSIDWQYIKTKRQGTTDGTVVWEIIDDIDEITYDWNVYNTFSYDLTVK